MDSKTATEFDASIRRPASKSHNKKRLASDKKLQEVTKSDDETCRRMSNVAAISAVASSMSMPQKSVRRIYFGVKVKSWKALVQIQSNREVIADALVMSPRFVMKCLPFKRRAHYQQEFDKIFWNRRR